MFLHRFCRQSAMVCQATVFRFCLWRIAITGTTVLPPNRGLSRDNFASQSRSFEGQLCLPIEVFRGTTLPPNRVFFERTIAALPLQGQHLVDYPNERHLKPSASKGDVSYTKVIQSDSFLQATLLPVTCRQGRQRRQCLPCHNHEMCKTN